MRQAEWLGARRARIRSPSHSYGSIPLQSYGISHVHMCMFVCECACTASKMNESCLIYPYAMSRIEAVTPRSRKSPHKCMATHSGNPSADPLGTLGLPCIYEEISIFFFSFSIKKWRDNKESILCFWSCFSPLFVVFQFCLLSFQNHSNRREGRCLPTYHFIFKKQKIFS